jgi:glycerate kinase
VVVAPDSFKGSMTAPLAAAAMSRGVRLAFPQAQTVPVPMSDGGEGMAAILAAALGGIRREVKVQGPLGQPVTASFTWVESQRLAVIESAEAAGLYLVPDGARDVRRASTFGVGQLLGAALAAGADRIVLGLGGTATNDGGAGMAQALGVQFKDAAGQELGPGGAALAGLASLDAGQLDPRWREVEVQVACDVDNPLLGPGGASAVFGPQKGATPEDVLELDAALAVYAGHLAKLTGRDIASQSGAGAAGGLAAGLVAFLGAQLVPGIDLMLRAVGFDTKLQGADLVLTGEGSLDSQTAAGKTPWGVALAAKRAGLPTIAFAGRIEEAAIPKLLELFQAVVPIWDGRGSLADAIANGPVNLEQAVARALAPRTNP